MPLEIFQVIHENLLFLHVLHDVCVVLCNLILREIDVRNLNICHIPFENEVSRCLLQGPKRFLNFAFWTEENLSLGSLAQEWEFAQSDEELIQIVLPLFNELWCHVTFILLGWNRWDVQTWVPTVEEVPKYEELTVSPHTIDLTKTVVSLYQVLSMLLHTRSFRLIHCDFKFHQSIVTFDVVHFQDH